MILGTSVMPSTTDDAPSGYVQVGEDGEPFAVVMLGGTQAPGWADINLGALDIAGLDASTSQIWYLRKLASVADKLAGELTRADAARNSRVIAAGWVDGDEYDAHTPAAFRRDG